MSGWAKGDLALCVCDRDVDGTPMEITKGVIYRVDEVGTDNKEIFDANSLCGIILTLAEITDPSFCASCFRKIKPDTEGANEDDAAWLKDLLTKKVKA